MVGSSMGGWVALLLARALAEAGESARLAGMVLIAPAVDFTEDLMWPQIARRCAREIMTEGDWRRPPDAYGEGLSADRALFEDGKRK